MNLLFESFFFLSGSVNNGQGKSIMYVFCVVGIAAIMCVFVWSENFAQ